MEEIPEGEEEPPEDPEELPYKTGVERPELDVEPEASLLDEEDGRAKGRSQQSSTIAFSHQLVLGTKLR